MTLLVEIALVALAAMGAAVCVARLPRAVGGAQASRSPVPPTAPQQLVALERLISTASATALHAHAYLRPVLAEVAAERLAAHGHSLGRMSEPAGRQLLGEDLWEIVRPDRPFPPDRYGPGVSRPELDAMLAGLERL